MSFFDDASLAFLPSGAAGKDGKAYSIKPTDGTGDFTFSRGSNLAATRVGADGLIEKGRENLLLQSNNFSTTWTTPDATITGGQADKDGGTDAWLLTATSAFNRLAQSISQSGVKRFSVYAKANTNDYLLLGSVEGAHFYATFNLATGAVDSNNINAISPSIEDVGNGWYRCSATWVGTTTEVRIASQATSGQGGWASTTSGNILIQDAQLEIGLAATDYIESGATTGRAGLLEDEPRFDYSGGATCPSLLLEPSRTQKLGYTEYFDEDTYWTKSDVLVDGGYLAPDGTNSAYKITNNGFQAYLVKSSVTNADDSRSIYAKTTSGTGQVHLLGHNTNANCIFTITEEWQRFEVSSVGNISTNFYPVDFRAVGTTLSEVIIWGAQAEEGSYPTSYIPNHSGGSVTRGADDCKNTTNISTIAPSSAGTMYLEYDASVESGGDYWVSLANSSSTITDWVFVGRNGASNRLYVRANGVVIDSTIILHELSGVQKLAIVWDESSGTAAYINGTKVDSTTNPFAFNGNFGYLTLGGSNVALSTGVVAPTKQLLIFPEALSDADCITLTTL